MPLDLVRMVERGRLLTGRESLPEKKRRAERPQRETEEVLRDAQRFVRALGRRVADGDPDDLALLRNGLAAAVTEASDIAVAGLRAQGHSDSDIGRALGITRQSVEYHWPRSKEQENEHVA